MTLPRRSNSKVQQFVFVHLVLRCIGGTLFITKEEQVEKRTHTSPDAESVGNGQGVQPWREEQSPPT
jgi:hypothetical protein